MLVYGAVRMEGILALASGLWASNSFVGYGVLVHSYAGAGINEASKAWLEYLKWRISAKPTALRALFSKIVAREIKSMKHLCIMGGSTFYYDRLPWSHHGDDCRPAFYYQILDEENNIILFAGVVRDPNA